MTTLWQEVVHWGEAAEAFLGSLISSEAKTVAPLAEDAFNELSTEESTALATGDAKDTGHILAKVVASTATKVATAGITAAPASVLVATSAAVAKAQANAAKGN